MDTRLKKLSLSRYYVYISMLEINFLAGSNYLISGIQASSKTYNLVAKLEAKNSPLTILQFSCQLSKIMPLTLWNCVKSYKQEQ